MSLVITTTLLDQDQAPFVQKLDSAIHQINHYLVDKILHYPVDKDLYGSNPPFEQLEARSQGILTLGSISAISQVWSLIRGMSAGLFCQTTAGN